MQRDTFEILSEQEGERLDKYLSTIYPDISRSFFQRILKDNQILVNDKPQKANYRLKTDDIVNVTIADAVQTPILPQDIPLDILYELASCASFLCLACVVGNSRLLQNIGKNCYPQFVKNIIQWKN